MAQVDPCGCPCVEILRNPYDHRMYKWNGKGTVAPSAFLSRLVQSLVANLTAAVAGRELIAAVAVHEPAAAVAGRELTAAVAGREPAAVAVTGRELAAAVAGRATAAAVAGRALFTAGRGFGTTASEHLYLDHHFIRGP